MPRITYSTIVSPAAAGETAEGFAREVDRVLADPRGWRKYGYSFVRVREGEGPDLLMRLETAADAGRLCGVEGFSCWRQGPGDIVIHEGNWLGGSASRLPVPSYHNYVISHEVGHALGLSHQRCPAEECARRGMATCPASVMQQMTQGPEAVSPCAETDWPLDPDWQVDDPGRGRRGVSLRPSLVVLAVVLAVILCLVLCLVRLVRTPPGGFPGRRGSLPGGYKPAAPHP